MTNDTNQNPTRKTRRSKNRGFKITLVVLTVLLILGLGLNGLWVWAKIKEVPGGLFGLYEFVFESTLEILPEGTEIKTEPSPEAPTLTLPSPAAQGEQTNADGEALEEIPIEEQTAQARTATVAVLLTARAEEKNLPEPTDPESTATPTAIPTAVPKMRIVDRKWVQVLGTLAMVLILLFALIQRLRGKSEE